MDTQTQETYPINPIVKIFIPLSLSAIILNVGPLIWHIRNRNIATTSLITWAILLNLINVVNASTWPRDNIPQWFNGKILYDIELRIMIGGVFGGLCAAVLCLAKSLSRVLDMKRQKSVIGKKQHVHDALLCVGVPAWFMIIFYFCA